LSSMGSFAYRHYSSVSTAFVAATRRRWNQKFVKRSLKPTRG